MKYKYKHYSKTGAKFFLAAVSSLTILGCSTSASAVDNAIDNVTVTVPVACSLTSTIGTAHTATIENNTYQSNIGETTFNVFCNDASGFDVYAVGYTDDTFGNNTLKPNTLSSSNSIATGLATSGATSNWAMKLTAVSGTNTPTITNSFNAYHAVPAEYTKVATYPSNTTTTASSQFTSTYAAYISAAQPADSYEGKVKYIVVHPANKPAPKAAPVSEALYYAITGEANNYTLTISDSNISSGAVSGGAVEVDGYEYGIEDDTPIINTPWLAYAQEITSVVVDGTVAPTSTATWFAGFASCDSYDFTGLYTNNVTDMAGMFGMAGYGVQNLSLNLSDWDVSSVRSMAMMFMQTGYYASTFSLDLSGWDTSSVTDMSFMFSNAGYNANTFSLDLSGWDTSSVTDMSHMFIYAGRNANTFSLDLSGWDTSSVTDMSLMFSGAGYNANTFSLDLSGWDTSSVTDMSFMFYNSGYNATTWSISGLSGWDTSSVTDMSEMFSNAGYNANTFSLDLSGWDTSSVTDMSHMFIYAGRNANTFSLDLSGWDTSSVTDMSLMFSGAGYNANTFSLDLSGWDTSSVTDMSEMFGNAGPSATTWSITIPATNGNGISNTSSALYGKTTSVKATPNSGKSFTLAS